MADFKRWPTTKKEAGGEIPAMARRQAGTVFACLVKQGRTEYPILLFASDGLLSSGA